MSTNKGLSGENNTTAQQKAFDAIYRDERYGNAESSIDSHKKDRSSYLNTLLSAFPDDSHKGRKCLEIGTGTGIDSCIVSKETGCLACGIDISREALSVARNFANQARVSLELQCGNALCLPFRDNSFDLVFSQGVLEHLGNDEAAIREQVRVLRKGGILVISVPQRYTTYTLVKHHRIRKGTWPWGYECEYSARQLTRLGRRHGLVLRSISGHGYWLHPLEPAWVLRSLWTKMQKINPARTYGVFAGMGRAYDRLWELLEKGLGHYFMRSVVAAFEKPAKPS